MPRIDKAKLVVMLITMVGVLLAFGGAILAYFFNFYAYTYDKALRFLGFLLGVFLVMVGSHIASAGIASIRSS